MKVSLKPIFADRFVDLKEKTLFDNMDIAGLLIVPEIFEFCQCESSQILLPGSNFIDKIVRERNQSFE
jgi:hypothetical protein